MTEHLAGFDDLLAPVVAYSTDIVADHAEGLWIYDREGNRYADFACGTAVTNLGHNHPRVIEAAREQMDRLVHAGGIFRYESIIRLAEKLSTVTPNGIEKFGFANSGAEAVEASVKLAKYVTGRQGVITMRGGFHGRTMGSVSYTTSSAR
jgi:4-aminobutyrate aminotransferase